jgi:hypothetical protein
MALGAGILDRTATGAGYMTQTGSVSSTTFRSRSLSDCAQSEFVVVSNSAETKRVFLFKQEITKQGLKGNCNFILIKVNTRNRLKDKA